ncbi:M6 family metalloprotease domain-containing protein [Virgibacillus siamensis]|uniref:M6 family metalloprotease domain-containing protein n=1 Tax=Virgibacillus siamensis TaxID=480071 RepID=UPI000984AC9B|nr:M6 family metalloprotease domain-containing protein [Virgibacillus siamensis]
MKPGKKTLIFIIALLMLSLPTTVLADQSGQPGLPSFPEPLDPQSWELPEHMTWNDYQPIPGIDWENVDIEPERKLKGALILVDFPDQQFVSSQPKGSDLAGNPTTVGDIPRDELAEFWEKYLNKPQSMNHNQTINSFWKENSYGQWEIELDAYGPYRVDHNEFQYGLNEFGQRENMPPGLSGKRLTPEALAAAEDDLGASGEEYDFKFILHAGYDESGVWQEFGEMKFLNPEAVTDPFGPPVEGIPNSATTRYVPWTSWWAASSIWSHAGGGASVQGENDGMGTFAHEFGHLKGLGDNYNNPYGTPVKRSYTGPWETMSRGSFNGPGGPHTRWMIPASLGSSVPAHHMLRNKIKQGFITEDQYLKVDSDELAETGPIFANIIAREVPIGDEFGRTGLYGISVGIDDDHYSNYTVEVVDRVGADSFIPDSGVLLAKTRMEDDRPPYIYAVDSHPKDINQVDFTRPDGTKAMYSKGDYRQLSDALFHAGTGDGVVNEYKDEDHGLHFYILEENRNDEGILSYRMAVRSLNGSGSFKRGVDVSGSKVERAAPGRVAAYDFSVTNTGEKTDLIRIQAKTKAGWETQTMHNVIEVKAGETKKVPVYVEIPENKQSPTKLTFTATSETNPDKKAAATNVLLNNISAKGMKQLVNIFHEDKEFSSDKAARALKIHLTAVEQFEKQEAAEKVVKHMQGFNLLLEHQTENELISDKAANALQFYADYVISQWS